MSKQNYNLHLKGYVGGWDFDADYVDFILAKNADAQVNVLVDSLGGSLAKALSIVAAFRNHGNVHVHYVGMNASAATIVSLGAAHVSMDASAMYLVHKCSMEFFQWASANSDKLQTIIEEAQQMKTDLEKMDANVAQMYASKCKRKCEDLLELMKKGGWLTAKEALEWGFVDEITEYADDAAPVIDDKIAADMGAAGIPIPDGIQQVQPSNVLTRIADALAFLFKNNPKTQSTMTPETTPTAQQTQQPAEQTQVQQPQAAVSAEEFNALKETVAGLQATVTSKDEEIASLRTEIDALKKAPGDDTTHIVDDKGNGQQTNAANKDFEDYVETFNRAKDIYDSLP